MEAAGKAEKRGAVAFSEGGAEGREEGERRLQRDKVAGVAGGKAQAGNGALHITDVTEDVAHRGKKGRIIMEGGNKVLPVGDSGKIAEWMKDPFTQEPRAHRGQGAVNRAAQAGALGAAGLDEFEVGLRDGVEKEVG